MAIAELEKTTDETIIVREKVGKAANELIVARRMAPMSERHEKAMKKLVEILTSEPGALDELIKEQNKIMK